MSYNFLKEVKLHLSLKLENGAVSISAQFRPVWWQLDVIMTALWCACCVMTSSINNMSSWLHQSLHWRARCQACGTLACWGLFVHLLLLLHLPPDHLSLTFLSPHQTARLSQHLLAEWSSHLPHMINNYASQGSLFFFSYLLSSLFFQSFHSTKPNPAKSSLNKPLSSAHSAHTPQISENFLFVCFLIIFMNVYEYIFMNLLPNFYKPH